MSEPVLTEQLSVRFMPGTLAKIEGLMDAYPTAWENKNDFIRIATWRYINDCLKHPPQHLAAVRQNGGD